MLHLLLHILLLKYLTHHPNYYLRDLNVLIKKQSYKSTLKFIIWEGDVYTFNLKIIHRLKP